MHSTLWTLYGLLFISTQIGMARVPKKQELNCITNGCRYVTISWKKYQTCNPYIKNYDPSTESSYLMYWDINNLYRWEMSQKM